MALPLLAVGQGFLSGLTSIFRFGHAKAVAAENSAIGAGQNQIQAELEKIETLAREGQLSDAEIDSRLQALLDGYYSTVSGVIKGRIASFGEFNPSSKKTTSGGSCNAACVIGGQVSDLVNAARGKLKAVAKEGRAKSGGSVSEMGILSPVASVVQRLPVWLLVLLPGGLFFALIGYFFFRKRRGR